MESRRNPQTFSIRSPQRYSPRRSQKRNRTYNGESNKAKLHPENAKRNALSFALHRNKIDLFKNAMLHRKNKFNLDTTDSQHLFFPNKNHQHDNKLGNDG